MRNIISDKTDKTSINFHKYDKYSTQLGLIVISIVVFGLFMITSPETFLRSDIYRTFLSTVPFVGIMALGLTYILALGEIDLSFPSVMALSGFIFSSVYATTDQVLLSILAALIVGVAIGLINGIMVSKIGIPSIIVSLGMMFFVRGLVDVLSQGLSITIRQFSDTIWYQIFCGKVFGVISAQAIWFLGVGIFLWFILFRHRFGDQILFCGDNKHTARLMGINVDWTIILVFIIMGVLASFAGILNIARMRTFWPSMGGGFMMTTMATVFIGGTSMFGGQATIFGTFIGAFIIGSLETGIIAAGVSGFWTQLIYGLLILLSVTIHTIVKKTGN